MFILIYFNIFCAKHFIFIWCLIKIDVTKVLIRKLRSANNLETRQYHKAAKALLVLIPLFGITYLLVLAGPSEDGLPKHLFDILRAFLLSTQVKIICFS